VTPPPVTKPEAPPKPATTPTEVAPSPAPGLPALTAPLALFDESFAKRLAGWNITDPLAWGVSEDVEGFPISGRGGEIVRPLTAMPGRLTGSVIVPEEASRVFIGVRDADGRSTGLLLLPLNGLVASMVTRGADGADAASAGSATMTERRVFFKLLFNGTRMTAVLRDAAVPDPLVITLPGPPIAVVLAAEVKSQTLFQDLRAEP